MSTYLLDLPDQLKKRRQHTIFDDFHDYVDGSGWTAVLTDTGTATCGDVVGGTIALTPSDGTVADNDQAYFHSDQECFKFAASKPMLFEAEVQFTKGTSSTQAILVGLFDGVAADDIVDGGLTLRADFDGAVFYKVDGGTVWKCESSNGTTRGGPTTTTVACGGAASQVLRIEYHPLTATVGEIVFFIDGVQVAKHAITFASAGNMQIVFGIKNGADTTVETLNIDYACCTQLR